MKNMKQFDEWVTLWNSQPTKINKSTQNLIFIVVFPDALSYWDFNIEKQLQITVMNVSGGLTGNGSGHHVKILHEKELFNHLTTLSKTITHAMIVGLGMTFDMVSTPTSIVEFYNFSKTKEFCRGHIIARPNKSAYLHHQHIELNLSMWRELNCPNIFGEFIWENFERADDNFHDDYTPSWIKVDGLPIINNFNRTQRNKKAYAYGYLKKRKEHQIENWKQLTTSSFTDNVDRSDWYFEIFLRRILKTFYILNNETLNSYKNLDKEFDLIITPSSGYIGETLSQKLNFKGEVVFYDYLQENLDIKEKIVNMNMSFSEIIFFLNHAKIDVNIDASNFTHLEKCYIECQSQMTKNCEVSYKRVDLINFDSDWLKEKVKDKKVFFNASNIYGYHVNHAVYTFGKIVDSWNQLHDILEKNSKYYCFRGARPNKLWEKIFYENICS